MSKLPATLPLLLLGTTSSGSTFSFTTAAATAVAAAVVPALSVRIDWRGDGFNYVTNDGFETDLFGGWAVSSGSALARITASAYVGSASAQVTTTTTLGTGATYSLVGTFTAGRTYRLQVAVKSVSGSTSARITLGSLGTTADRTNLLQTLTTTWAVYTVDWTPSGTRTDAIVQVVNNAAAVMVATFDHVEVFELIDEVMVTTRAFATALSYGRGASFDGSSDSPGAAALTLVDLDGRYAPNNTASPLYGLVKPNRPIWVRATYNGVVYPLYAGTVRRFIPRPADFEVDVQCEDPLYNFSRAETSVSLSPTRSLRTYREAILADLGEPNTRWALAADSPEQVVAVTGVDQVDALNALADVNVATGSLHYIRPHASSSVRYQYRTIARTELASTASTETYADDLNDLSGYDVTDEAVVNTQRVAAESALIGSSTTVWASGPVHAEWLGNVTLWASFDDPVINPILSAVLSTGSGSITMTPFSQSAKIVVTANVGGVKYSSITITGQPVMSGEPTSVLSTDPASVTSHGTRKGSDITSPFIPSTTIAEGLGSWIVFRYGTNKSRPTITVVNRFPSQFQRDVADRITVSFARLYITSVDYLVRSFSTTASDGGTVWTTVYQLEEAPAIQNLFRIGGTPDQGVGGTAVLGY